MRRVRGKERERQGPTRVGARRDLDTGPRAVRPFKPIRGLPLQQLQPDLSTHPGAAELRRARNDAASGASESATRNSEHRLGTRGPGEATARLTVPGRAGHFPACEESSIRGRSDAHRQRVRTANLRNRHDRRSGADRVQARHSREDAPAPARPCPEAVNSAAPIAAMVRLPHSHERSSPEAKRRCGSVRRSDEEPSGSHRPTGSSVLTFGDVYRS